MFKAMSGVCTALAVFLITVNATAQDLPKGRWWTNPRVVKILNLNDAEVEQLEKEFMEWRSRVVHLKGHMSVTKHEIDDWKARKSSNPQGKEEIIQELNSELEKSRSLLEKAKPTYVDKVRATLGPARFEKLLSLKP
jgi:FtsZ-binding cell division protein ZapB